MKTQLKLFLTILADTYEADKTDVEIEGDTVFITEPQQIDCLYYAYAIIGIAEILHLTSYVILRHGKLQIVVT